MTRRRVSMRRNARLHARRCPGRRASCSLRGRRSNAPVRELPMQHATSRLLCAALLFTSLAVNAAKPAIPVVTVGAEFKQLQFEVEPVPGASYYELWFLPNGGASWVKWTSTLAADPLFKVNVSAHLLDWFNARYRVTACNADGCATTANISVTSRLKETVGFFKPRSAAVDPRFFGLSRTMSKDGKTMVVLGGEKVGPRAFRLTP